MTDFARYDWTDVQAYFSRMGVATGGAVHHTASVPAGWAYDPAYLRSIEHGEMKLGYNALAYHQMGFLNGDTAEARPLGAMGAATGGHNGDTIAFCAIGYFHEPYYDQPTEQLILAAARFFYAARAFGFMTWEAPIKPHAEWTKGTQWATACCGSEFIPVVARIDELSRTPGVVAPPVSKKKAGQQKMILIHNSDGTGPLEPNSLWFWVNTETGWSKQVPAGPNSVASRLVDTGTPWTSMPGQEIVKCVDEWKALWLKRAR